MMIAGVMDIDSRLSLFSSHIHSHISEDIMLGKRWPPVYDNSDRMTSNRAKYDEYRYDAYESKKRSYPIGFNNGIRELQHKFTENRSKFTQNNTTALIADHRSMQFQVNTHIPNIDKDIGSHDRYEGDDLSLPVNMMPVCDASPSLDDILPMPGVVVEKDKLSSMIYNMTKDVPINEAETLVKAMIKMLLKRGNLKLSTRPAKVDLSELKHLVE
jgi:hypothetical protein